MMQGPINITYLKSVRRRKQLTKVCVVLLFTLQFVFYDIQLPVYFFLRGRSNKWSLSQ